jgi:hypothetical protein
MDLRIYESAARKIKGEKQVEIKEVDDVPNVVERVSNPLFNSGTSYTSLSSSINTVKL